MKAPEAFQPWGMGPRACPGQALAIQEMRTLLKLVCIDGLRIDFEDPKSRWVPAGLTPKLENGRSTIRFDGAPQAAGSPST